MRAWLNHKGKKTVRKYRLATKRVGVLSPLVTAIPTQLLEIRRILPPLGQSQRSALTTEAGRDQRGFGSGFIQRSTMARTSTPLPWEMRLANSSVWKGR